MRAAGEYEPSFLSRAQHYAKNETQKSKHRSTLQGAGRHTEHKLGLKYSVNIIRTIN